MKPNAAEVEALIERYLKLGARIKRLQTLRATIAAEFPNGRTEGTERAVYKSGGGYRNEVSVRLLRQYVTEEVLDRCTVRSKFRGGTLRLVEKRKMKK